MSSRVLISWGIFFANEEFLGQNWGGGRGYFAWGSGLAKIQKGFLALPVMHTMLALIWWQSPSIIASSALANKILTTPLISCLKYLLASASGIPTSGSEINHQYLT